MQRLHRWSLGMEKWFHLTLYIACNYLSTLVLNLIHVIERSPRWLAHMLLRRKFNDINHANGEKWYAIAPMNWVIINPADGKHTSNISIWVKLPLRTCVRKYHLKISFNWQYDKTLPRSRHRPNHLIKSISWLSKVWWRKETGCQWLCYWPRPTRIFRPQH